MTKRTLLAIGMLLLSAICAAQGYPSRPITFIVPAPPGGSLDTFARNLAQEMGKQIGQPIIVDNKPGGGGVLAVQTVTRAAPDGYTVLLTHSAPIVSVPYLVQKVPYDVRRDLAFISQVAIGRIVLAVNRSVPVSNMTEFLAWAASNKGKAAFGSYGVGSFGHLAGTYLCQSRGLDMAHVPYKGEAPMVQDLAAGQIAWGIASLGSMRPYIESGKVRPIAVFGDRRAKNLPNVPSMAELGLTDPELKPLGWTGMLVRAGTQPAILAQLERAARAAAWSVPVKASLDLAGSEPVGNTGAEFRREFEAIEPTVRHMIEVSGAKAE